MCGAWSVYRRKRMTHSRKWLLFTLLITAALRSRLMSECCFPAAVCPRQNNMVLRIKRKWKMICSSARSNSVSFLSVSLSPPGAVPHRKVGGGISVLPAQLHSWTHQTWHWFLQQDKILAVTLWELQSKVLCCSFTLVLTKGSGCPRGRLESCLLSLLWRKNSVMKLGKC